MATNTIAEAPFGQAVATQKSSTAPIVTNARAALTTAGSQSGTPGRTSRCPAGGPAGGIDEQRQSVEHARHAVQAPWPSRRRAAAAMACRSSGRAAFAPPARKRAAGSLDRPSSAVGEPGSHADRSSGGNAAQDSFRAPADPRRPASVSDVPQLPRQPSSAANRPWTAVCNVDDLVAQVAGLPERLVDHRVERDDAADEFASLGLRVRQLRPRQRQHAGKSARDIGRQIGE